eukprot:g2945.t1
METDPKEISDTWSYSIDVDKEDVALAEQSYDQPDLQETESTNDEHQPYNIGLGLDKFSERTDNENAYELLRQENADLRSRLDNLENSIKFKEKEKEREKQLNELLEAQKSYLQQSTNELKAAVLQAISNVIPQQNDDSFVHKSETPKVQSSKSKKRNRSRTKRLKKSKSQTRNVKALLKPSRGPTATKTNTIETSTEKQVDTALKNREEKNGHDETGIVSSSTRDFDEKKSAVHEDEEREETPAKEVEVELQDTIHEGGSMYTKDSVEIDDEAGDLNFKFEDEEEDLFTSNIDTATQQLLNKSRALLDDSLKFYDTTISTETTKTPSTKAKVSTIKKKGKTGTTKKTRKKKKATRRPKSQPSPISTSTENTDGRPQTSTGSAQESAQEQEGVLQNITTPLYKGKQHHQHSSVERTNMSTMQHENYTLLPSPIKQAPLTKPMIDRHWENQVAKNILTLYRSNMNTKPKQSNEHNQMSKTRRDPRSKKNKKLPPLRANNKTAAKPVKATETLSAKYKGKAVRTSRPNHIWFSGGGDVGRKAVWRGLLVANAEEALAEVENPQPSALERELEILEDQGRYRKYIALVEGLLKARGRIFKTSLRKKKSKRSANDQNIYNIRLATVRQWRQLAVVTNIFGMKCVNEGRFVIALTLLKKAKVYASMDHGEILDEVNEEDDDVTGEFSAASRHEMKAFVNDSMAYYYYRRHKPSAALQYIQKALRTHRRLEQWHHTAKCLLHLGCILSKLKKHDGAIRAMGDVLQMVEDERLEHGGASAQKICMIAVTYHNIAVEQLLISRVHEACVSSQNARRLAKLSLSYSNRWLRDFENTHQAALNSLSTSIEVRQKLRTKEQAQLFRNLSGALFS